MPAITDVNDLQDMENDLAGNYWLANDIDASATVGWNGGAGFLPIGQGAPYFSGSLDSKGYVISGLFINRPGTDNVGLFGIITTGAVLTDVVLENADITGDDYVGGIAGYIYNGADIIDSSVEGSITGSDHVGGLTGWSSGASGNHNTFTRCHTNIAVTGNTAGGFADGAGFTDFDICYSLGTVEATTHGGGFTRTAYGNNCVVTFNDCYSRCSVHAGVGGGDCAGFIRDSTVWGTGSVTIINCYSTGAVSSDAGDAYGFIYITDVADTTITACFWDTETSGTALSDGGTGKTTSQMKTKATFTAVGWDFIIIWGINGITNDGYPFFWVMPPEPLPDAPRATVAVQDKITLEAVRNVEMAAGGRFYINEEGNAVYKSRYARNA